MTQSSFYADGETYDTAVVTSNDVPASTVPSQAPSGFYPNGGVYNALTDESVVLAEMTAIENATAASAAAGATSATNAAASASSAASSLSTLLSTLSSYVTNSALVAALLSYAPLLSPAFTGNPTAPTRTVGDNTTSIATTAFVLANSSAASYTPNGTGAITRTYAGKLQEIVSVTDFGASPGAAAATNDTAFQKAADTGYAVYVPIGTYAKSATVNITVNGTKFYGPSKNQSILTSSSTTAPLFTIANNVGSVEITQLGLTRSVTASSGAAGVLCSGYLDTSTVTNCEVSKQYVGIQLGATGYGLCAENFVHDCLSDGIRLVNTATNGNLQWCLRKNLVQLNAGVGYAVRAAIMTAAGQQVTLGTWFDNDTFANGSYGMGFFGGPGGAGAIPPINGVRIHGGFVGSDGSSQLYFNTYGGQHHIDGVFAELAGRTPTGPGFVNAASGVGHGIEVTLNNLDFTICNVVVNGNSAAGLSYLPSANLSLTSSTFNNNGTYGNILSSGFYCTLSGNTYANNTSGPLNLLLSAGLLSAFACLPISVNNQPYPVFTGSISAVGKGHIIGTAGGTIATGALATSDANVVLYTSSSVNWAGYGADNNGAFWVRVGYTSNGPAAFWIDPNTIQSNFTGAVKSNAPTGGIGYSAGAGGSVTQATSKATGVTLNKVSGQITMNAAALAAGTIVSFAFTNSAIAVGDVLVINHASGGTLGSYTFNASCGAGTATVYVRNETAASLSEAIVIQYVLIKGTNS